MYPSVPIPQWNTVIANESSQGYMDYFMGRCIKMDLTLPQLPKVNSNCQFLLHQPLVAIINSIRKSIPLIPKKPLKPIDHWCPFCQKQVDRSLHVLGVNICRKCAARFYASKEWDEENHRLSRELF